MVHRIDEDMTVISDQATHDSSSALRRPGTVWTDSTTWRPFHQLEPKQLSDFNKAYSLQAGWRVTEYRLAINDNTAQQVLQPYIFLCLFSLHADMTCHHPNHHSSASSEAQKHPNLQASPSNIYPRPKILKFKSLLPVSTAGVEMMDHINLKARILLILSLPIFIHLSLPLSISQLLILALKSFAASFIVQIALLEAFHPPTWLYASR